MSLSIKQSVGNMAANFPGMTASAAKAPSKIGVSDAFSRFGQSEQLDADKMKSLQTNRGKESLGMNGDSKSLLGIGIMLGGLAVAAATASPLLALASVFGGLALASS